MCWLARIGWVVLVLDNTITHVEQIPAWFLQRWKLEVTFEEARRHLGVETQRQSLDLAISRTTPVLPGLASLVTLFAQHRLAGPMARIRRAAWYPNAWPTFSDALALLRRELWANQALSWSAPERDLIKNPAPPRGALDTDALLRCLNGQSRA